MTPAEEAGLVARIENTTGVCVKAVEHVTLLPPLSGECACGNHIPAFICVQWCDECFDAFDAKVAEGHPDPFEGPRERWRANGWTGDAA